MEKLVKANKPHKCDVCENEIAKGETYRNIQIRVPKMELYNKDAAPEDEYYIQKGIEYHKFKQHNYDCTAPFECQIGNHRYQYEHGMCGDKRVIDEGFYCVGCHRYLKELHTMEELQEMDLKNIEEKGYSNNNI